MFSTALSKKNFWRFHFAPISFRTAQMLGKNNEEGSYFLPTRRLPKCPPPPRLSCTAPRPESLKLVHLVWRLLTTSV
jgi:hypothetical protein